MRDDLQLNGGRLATCHDAAYGVRAEAIACLPIGYDFNAAD
jgi:hypothetical protein